MNDNIRNIFLRIIGFAILGGGLWLLYKVTLALFTLLATLQKEVVAAILAALTAVGVSVLSLILSKYYGFGPRGQGIRDFPRKIDQGRSAFYSDRRFGAVRKNTL